LTIKKPRTLYARVKGLQEGKRVGATSINR
jgi:hypothetical protein